MVFTGLISSDNKIFLNSKFTVYLFYSIENNNFTPAFHCIIKLYFAYLVAE